MTPLAKGVLEENRMLIEKGMEKSQKKIVKNMIKLNFSNEIIAKITEMKESEIDEIRG